MSMTHDTTICHDCGGEGVIETTIGGDGDPSEAAGSVERERGLILLDEDDEREDAMKDDGALQ